MVPKIGIDRPATLHIRVPKDLLEQARRMAAANGETLTALVERAIKAELTKATPDIPHP
jgi:predicted HicB family RNase H-like nuclease